MPVKKREYSRLAIEAVILFSINAAMMFAIGYLTLYSGGGFLLILLALLFSIAAPLLITYLTPDIDGANRVLQFGSGLFCYGVLYLFLTSLVKGFTTLFFPCCMTAVMLFIYGTEVLEYFGVAPPEEEEEEEELPIEWQHYLNR